MYRFVFKNKDTGELREGVGNSLNLAARKAGINREFGEPFPEPWTPWEMWEMWSKECVWHYTDNGECKSGSR